MMRVLVCGGRNYYNFLYACLKLDEIHAKTPITLIIEGGANGADRLARRWAIVEGVPYETHEANWTRYRQLAGSERNTRMLREGKPDLVVAFPGGKGTRHMVTIATEAGVETIWA